MFGFWEESSRKLGMSSPPETELRGRQYAAPTIEGPLSFLYFQLLLRMR
jgi:hypothetical protein